MRMLSDRISRLVRQAAVDSDLSSASRTQRAKVAIQPQAHAVPVRVAPRSQVPPTASKSSPSTAQNLSVSPRLQNPAPGSAASKVRSAAAGPSLPLAAAAQKKVSAQALPGIAVAPSLAKADFAVAEQNDELLPPEGSGNPPAPVILTLAPLPSPAPARHPAPVVSPSPSSQSHPTQPPGNSPSASPTGSPVSVPTTAGASQPASTTTPVTPQPSLFGAPPSLAPFPAPAQPGSSPGGRIPLGPLPTYPVAPLPQPEPYRGPVSYTQPVAAWQPCSAEPPTSVSPTFPNAAPALSAQDGAAASCCCTPVPALVGIVATTSQTAITAITAIASL